MGALIAIVFIIVCLVVTYGSNWDDTARRTDAKIKAEENGHDTYSVYIDGKLETRLTSNNQRVSKDSYGNVRDTKGNKLFNTKENREKRKEEYCKWVCKEHGWDFYPVELKSMMGKPQPVLKDMNTGELFCFRLYEENGKRMIGKESMKIEYIGLKKMYMYNLDKPTYDIKEDPEWIDSSTKKDINEYLAMTLEHSEYVR